jgi:hypothetical protein
VNCLVLLFLILQAIQSLEFSYFFIFGYSLFRYLILRIPQNKKTLLLNHFFLFPILYLFHITNSYHFFISFFYHKTPHYLLSIHHLYQSTKTTTNFTTNFPFLPSLLTYLYYFITKLNYFSLLEYSIIINFQSSFNFIFYPFLHSLILLHFLHPLYLFK